MSHNLNYNERRALLDLYSEMYFRTLLRVDDLNETLREIRNQIISIDRNYYQNSNRRNNSSFDSYRNQNTTRQQNFRPEHTRQQYTRQEPRNNTVNGISYIIEQLSRTIPNNFYDPVPVLPSTTDISLATRVVQFSNIENPLNNSCPISLERFNPDDSVTQIIHCGHIFNTSQINAWFQGNVRCPVCRYDIRRYSRHSYTRPSENETEVNNENININENANTETNNESTEINNFAIQTISDLLQTNRNTNFAFDPSNNAFFFETIFRRF